MNGSSSTTTGGTKVPYIILILNTKYYLIYNMSKQGFKPKWTQLHTKRADQFEETYLEKGKKDIVSDPDDFMKWAYGKKA